MGTRPPPGNVAVVGDCRNSDPELEEAPVRKALPPLLHEDPP